MSQLKTADIMLGRLMKRTARRLAAHFLKSVHSVAVNLTNSH